MNFVYINANTDAERRGADVSLRLPRVGVAEQQRPGNLSEGNDM